MFIIQHGHTRVLSCLPLLKLVTTRPCLSRDRTCSLSLASGRWATRQLTGSLGNQTSCVSEHHIFPPHEKPKHTPPPPAVQGPMSPPRVRVLCCSPDATQEELSPSWDVPPFWPAGHELAAAVCYLWVAGYPLTLTLWRRRCCCCLRLHPDSHCWRRARRGMIRRWHPVEAAGVPP